MYKFWLAIVNNEQIYDEICKKKQKTVPVRFYQINKSLFKFG